MRKLSTETHETTEKILELDLLNSKLALQVEKFKLVLCASGSVGHLLFAQIFKLKYINLFNPLFQSQNLQNYRESIHFFMNESDMKMNTMIKFQSNQTKKMFSSPKKHWDEFRSLSFVDNQSYIHTPKTLLKSDKKPPLRLFSDEDLKKKCKEFSENPHVQELLTKKSFLSNKKRCDDLRRILDKARQRIEFCEQLQAENSDIVFVKDLNFMAKIAEVEGFLEQVHFNQQKRPKKFRSGVHILFLVHGMNGSFEDMNIFRSNLAHIRQDLLVVNIMNVEDQTHLSLDKLGESSFNSRSNFRQRSGKLDGKAHFEFRVQNFIFRVFHGRSHHPLGTALPDQIPSHFLLIPFLRFSSLGHELQQLISGVHRHELLRHFQKIHQHQAAPPERRVFIPRQLHLQVVL